MKPKIAVVIPVGPEEHHAHWLDQCLISVAEQTRPPDDVVLVDDMHGDVLALAATVPGIRALSIATYEPPWRLGVAHAFNAGSAVAFNRGADLALMLGADDTIQPRVIEAVLNTYESKDRAEGYYFCEVHYSDDTPDQTVPCNCAAWTRGLFERSGGFAIESASGGCDAAFISQMMVHDKYALIQVPGQPNAWFWHRRHAQQETQNQAPGMNEIRNWLTNRYTETNWGRGLDA